MPSTAAARGAELPPRGTGKRKRLRPVRMVRDIALRVGAVVPPFRQMITARLMGTRRRVSNAA